MALPKAKSQQQKANHRPRLPSHVAPRPLPSQAGQKAPQKRQRQQLLLQTPRMALAMLQVPKALQLPLPTTVPMMARMDLHHHRLHLTRISSHTTLLLSLLLLRPQRQPVIHLSHRDRTKTLRP